MTFPTTLDTDFGTLVDNVDDAEASNVNELRRAIEGLEAKVGINSSVVSASLDYKVNNFFVSGRKLYLYENTAPTGWTIVAVTDKVLAVKGGSNAYNVSGGNAAGSFSMSVAQMPPHSHTYGLFTTKGWGSSVAENFWPAGAVYSTSLTGGGDGTFRPAAAVGIIVSKDA